MSVLSVQGKQFVWDGEPIRLVPGRSIISGSFPSIGGTG